MQQKLILFLFLCFFVIVFSLYNGITEEGMIGIIDQKCQVKYGEDKKYLVKSSYCCVSNQYDVSNCKRR